MVRVTRRRWILGAVAVWAALLLVLAFVARGRPTVKEQQSPAAARPAVDAAIGTVSRAAGPRAVVAVSGYEQVKRCTMAAARPGVEYARTADVYGAAGLADHIRAGLPAAYKAAVVPDLGGSGTVTVAHPDPFVKLTVRTATDDPGHVVAIADTGCRPTTGHPYPEFVAAPTAAERAPATRLFALLHVTLTTWQRHALGCGAVTVTATGLAADSLAPLPATLDRHPQPGHLLAHDDDRYVYRDGATGLVVTADRDRLTVTTTTTCH